MLAFIIYLFITFIFFHLPSWLLLGPAGSCIFTPQTTKCWAQNSYPIPTALQVVRIHPARGAHTLLAVTCWDGQL